MTYLHYLGALSEYFRHSFALYIDHDKIQQLFSAHFLFHVSKSSFHLNHTKRKGGFFCIHFFHFGITVFIRWQSMVYELLLNLIGSLLLYSEFIWYWFAFYGTFEQLILYWFTFYGICDGFVRKLCGQMLELSHTAALTSGDKGQPGSTTLLRSLKRPKIIQWCTSYMCHLIFYLFTIHAWMVSSRKFVIWVCRCMRDEYQQDRVGLGPIRLHELANF